MSDLFPKRRLHQIIKALAHHGRMRYSELKRNLDVISPKTLTVRLRELEELDILKHEVLPEVTPRVKYELTGKGMDLNSALDDFCERAYRWNLSTQDSRIVREER